MSITLMYVVKRDFVDAARGELVNEFARQERDQELAPGRKEGDRKARR
jgi:hypothetical protein